MKKLLRLVGSIIILGVIFLILSIPIVAKLLAFFIMILVAIALVIAAFVKLFDLKIIIALLLVIVDLSLLLGMCELFKIWF